MRTGAFRVTLLVTFLGSFIRAVITEVAFLVTQLADSVTAEIISGNPGSLSPVTLASSATFPAARSTTTMAANRSLAR